MRQPLVYSVARSTYLVFGVFGGTFTALGIWASVAQADWQPAVWCSLPLLVGLAWLSRYRLEFGDTYVAYRSWAGTRRLGLTDIDGVGFAGVPLLDPLVPSSVCVLRSRAGGSISVNVKMFPREAALLLVSLAQGYKQPLQRTSDEGMV